MQNTIEEVKPKKSCKSCKSSEKLKSVPAKMLVFSVLLLTFSIYGLIQFVKDIISLF